MAPRRHDTLVPLSHDHRDALALAFRLHNPSPPGPATAVTPPSTAASRAAEVVDFFIAHLEGHFRAEEEVLFPALASHVAPDAPIAALLAQLATDHREIAALAAPLHAFADALERHVRREERELFGQLGAILDDAEARALAAPIRAILDARPPLECRVPARLKR